MSRKCSGLVHGLYIYLENFDCFNKVLAFGKVVCVRYTVDVNTVESYTGGGVGEGKLITVGGG